MGKPTANTATGTSTRSRTQKQTKRVVGKKTKKRSRAKRAGVAVQPYWVDHAIRAKLNKGQKLGQRVAVFGAGAFSKLGEILLQDIVDATGPNKQISAQHIAATLANSDTAYHGMFPHSIANVFAVDAGREAYIQEYIEAHAE